ncbi:retrovirus-related pol polyprotein from transposon TNT 1-94 [Tanacetum coccineum]
MKNNPVCKENASNVFRKEREQYHEIQDLKAQMQDKNMVINELKKLILVTKGKSVETQFDKPSVVRQPNAQRIPKPSVLGKPTPFSNSPEMRSFQTKKCSGTDRFGNDSFELQFLLWRSEGSKITIKWVNYREEASANFSRWSMSVMRIWRFGSVSEVWHTHAQTETALMLRFCAARTMLSASKLPLSFWAEAVATACYTQNRSIIISTHGKTAYHIINDRKPL